MTPLSEEGREERILVLAPRGRDAVLARDALQGAGLSAHICRDLDELAAELPAGAGAILVAEEAITPRRIEPLAAALDGEPTWSDLPIVVLMAIRIKDGRAPVPPPPRAASQPDDAGPSGSHRRPGQRAAVGASGAPPSV